MRIVTSLSGIGPLIGSFVAMLSLNQFLSLTTSVGRIVGRFAAGYCDATSVLLAAVLVVSLRCTGGGCTTDSSNSVVHKTGGNGSGRTSGITGSTALFIPINRSAGGVIVRASSCTTKLSATAGTRIGADLGTTLTTCVGTFNAD